jgi:nucleoside-triphosphatase THEP1
MILVLAGAVHSGKTTFLKNLLPSLEALRLPVCGYLSPSVMVEGRILGYDLLDVRKGQAIPFLRMEGEAGWQKVGSYFFLPGGLEAATAAIRGHKPGETLIVDEVGPMELSGRGIWPALKEALLKPSSNCLLVVRKPLVRDLRGMLGNQQVEVFDIAAGNVLRSLLMGLSKMAAGSRTRRPRRRGRAGS